MKYFKNWTLIFTIGKCNLVTIYKSMKKSDISYRQLTNNFFQFFFSSFYSNLFIIRYYNTGAIKYGKKIEKNLRGSGETRHLEHLYLFFFFSTLSSLLKIKCDGI